MDFETLFSLSLKISIIFTVFALGLRTSMSDALFLCRRPRQLGRTLLAMNLIVPAVAITLALSFNLLPAVKIAIVALALSPVPPYLPLKQIREGGGSPYSFGLLVAAGLFSIIFVPIALEIVGRIFALPLQLSMVHVMLIVVITVLAPLGAGIGIRHVMPVIAERVAVPILFMAVAILLVTMACIFFVTWPEMMSLVGNGTLAALVLFSIIALAVGHFLGGPDPADRTVLALSTTLRHPAIAMAIAAANFPEQKLVLAALLLYIITSTIVSKIYTLSFKSRAGEKVEVMRRSGHLMTGKH